MKLGNTHKQKSRLWLTILVIVAGAIMSTTVLSTARSTTGINITVTNSSQRQIRHLYLAAGDPNNWGPDQLTGATIQPGGSFTLSNVSCAGSTMRVIAEDQNGCFLYFNASCDSNQTWDITDNATPDCGG